MLLNGIMNQSSAYFIILAGLPTTTALSGTSFVTTAPAPTIEPIPKDVG